MNDFNSAFKKLFDWIEHNINTIASIMGILCFFGIDFSKIKPFILLAINKLKNCAYRVKQNVTYKYKKAKNILFQQYSKIVKTINGIISCLVKSFSPLLSCCLLLFAIFIFNSFNYINIIRMWNFEWVTKDSDFNQNTVNSKMQYVASGNVDNQFDEKIICEDNVKPENSYNSIFYTDVDENDLEEVIKNEIDTLRNRCKENIPLDQKASSDAYFYSKSEADLFNKNFEFLPSDLLDQIIKGREDLYKSYPSGTIAWLLANSYQTYAYNLLKQKNEDDMILYYYMQSIYYAKMSLEFDMDAEDKEKRIKYIQRRYEDIAYCINLDEKTRLRVYKVSKAIDNVLDS